MSGILHGHYATRSKYRAEEPIAHVDNFLPRGTNYGVITRIQVVKVRGPVLSHLCDPCVRIQWSDHLLLLYNRVKCGRYRPQETDGFCDSYV